MLLTTHALTGAVLGKNIGNIWILIPASIILHFAMDHLRHGEYAETLDKSTSFKNTWWKVAIDISISAIIILSFIYFDKLSLATSRNVLLGSFFSAFPDLLTVIYWKFNFKFLAPIYKFHSWCHKYTPGAKERKWNMQNGLNDLAVSALAIIIFILF